MKVKLISKTEPEIKGVPKSESLIAYCARVSNRKNQYNWKTAPKLIKYLVSNKHWCYKPSNEVLTTRGWVKWEDTNDTEIFLVPEPKTGKLLKEELKVVSFDYEGDMLDFKSNKFNISVTPDHIMWFKKKFQGLPQNAPSFKKYKAKYMPVWGHLQTNADYSIPHSGGSLYPEMALVGMYLGDGFLYSKNILAFRFKKSYKIDFVTMLLDKLNIDYTLTVDAKGVSNIHFSSDCVVKDYLDVNLKAGNKQLYFNVLPNLNGNQLIDLAEGLIKSDGSISKQRLGQMKYCTSSKILAEQVQYVFTVIGLHVKLSVYYEDAERSTKYDVCCFYDAVPTVEMRKQYKSVSQYSGKIYCTTSSNGLLMVRGNSKSYGFVCGNSPLEMVNICFEIQTTRAISAQIMRHRSISFQELSQRYSDDIAVEFPELRMKGSTNRQGSSDTLAPDTLKLVSESSLNSAYNAYKLLIEQGVALETARMILPMCTETTVYANGTLRSWIHFCAQRSDKHAQKEIQLISNEIYKLLGEHYPNVIEAINVEM